MNNLFKIFVLYCLMAFVVSCNEPTDNKIATENVRTIEQRVGTVYTSVKSAHFKPPVFESLSLPDDVGAVSWGASGRDDQGNIYIGVSTYSQYHDSAFLYQINAKTQQITPQSDVISQLKRTGFYKEGTSQNKLHSKFYQADDGYVYFSSFDEQGESASRNILPKHGSHLWRKKPNDVNWEHLLATKEALIAINTDGRYVYALGYWNHVIYQFDTLSRRFNRVTVGSANGHVSRNFMVSNSGRLFVPKVESLPDKTTMVNLQEYDSDLNLMDTHPLEHYVSRVQYGDHGIVSYVNMKNGDIYFTTAKGALYQITRTANNKHNVTFITFLNEENQPESYFPSMFSIDGEDFVVGLGTIKTSSNYTWFIHQISSQTTVYYEVEQYNKGYLLYGSVTRDNDGNLYVVGVDRNDRTKHIPQILKLRYSDQKETTVKE